MIFGVFDMVGGGSLVRIGDTEQEKRRNACAADPAAKPPHCRVFCPAMRAPGHPRRYGWLGTPPAMWPVPPVIVAASGRRRVGDRPADSQRLWPCARFV